MGVARIDTCRLMSAVIFRKGLQSLHDLFWHEFCVVLIASPSGRQAGSEGRHPVRKGRELDAQHAIGRDGARGHIRVSPTGREPTSFCSTARPERSYRRTPMPTGLSRTGFIAISPAPAHPGYRTCCSARPTGRARTVSAWAGPPRTRSTTRSASQSIVLNLSSLIGQDVKIQLNSVQSGEIGDVGLGTGTAENQFLASFTAITSDAIRARPRDDYGRRSLCRHRSECRQRAGPCADDDQDRRAQPASLGLLGSGLPRLRLRRWQPAALILDHRHGGSARSRRFHCTICRERHRELAYLAGVTIQARGTLRQGQDGFIAMLPLALTGGGRGEGLQLVVSATLGATPLPAGAVRRRPST